LLNITPRPVARDFPIASSSSMKMMQGARCLLEKISDAGGADTHEDLMNSDPDIEKNGTFASPAFARRVLPVPGGPTSNTPFGMRPPRLVYFCGFLRKSTTSISSASASSTPATSLNVTSLCLDWS
jgi:hypothetical protein